MEASNKQQRAPESIDLSIQLRSGPKANVDAAAGEGSSQESGRSSEGVLPPIQGFQLQPGFENMPGGLSMTGSQPGTQPGQNGATGTQPSLANLPYVNVNLTNQPVEMPAAETRRHAGLMERLLKPNRASIQNKQKSGVFIDPSQQP